ncbi:hypothetical protein ACFVGY_35015 [Streptomyces sp. NPDC127106]|uniref:hypothetical protein n=1 Tax=Streptomyces sp. NPDC127106 TaxID=3345360 RepID=UPI003638423C
MMERARRQPIVRLSKGTDSTIPMPAPAETGMVSILSVGFRWGSLLTAAAAAATVVGVAPPELLLTLAPAVFVDRTFASYLRIRRS